MKKAKSDSVTKLKLLDAAQRLMLAKGYSETSVDEICESAGLTKGSFFHYFKSKEDLGEAVLDHFMTSMVRAAQDSPLLMKKDPLHRFYGHIDFIIQVSRDPERRSGCLLGNFAQVLADTHPKIRMLCDNHFKTWAGMLKKEMDEAKKEHGIKNVDTELVAEHFIALFEGSLMLAKTRGDIKIIERNLKNFKSYVQSIFGK